jgi:tetratricopeptide (TPR) repeat protein
MTRLKSSIGTLTGWGELFCAGVITILPLFTYPLSWLPRAAGFRFLVELPISAMALCIGMLLVAWASFKKESEFALARSLVAPLVLLIVSAMLSVRFSERSFFSVQVLPVVAGNITIFLVAAIGARRREFLHPLAWCWVATALLVSANMLIRIGSETELVSTFGNRNFLGAYLAASISIALTLLGKNSPRRKKLGILVAISLMLVSLALTHSRGAWLTVALTLALYVLIVAPRWRMLTILCGVGTILAIVIAGRWYIVSELRTDVRPWIWSSTARMIAARPFVGHGLNTFATEYVRYRSPEYFRLSKSANLTDHAHNELLEVAAEQGLLGLLATTLLWATVLYYAFRRRDAANLGFVLALVVFVLHGMVDVDLRHAPNQQLLWLLLGLVFASSYNGPDVRWRFSRKLSRLVIAPLCTCAVVWMIYACISKPVLAGCSERRARLAEAAGNLEAAERFATKAVAIEPLNIARRYYFAGILSQIPTAAAHSRAIEQAKIIESLAPDYGDITFNLGQLYLAAGQLAEALPYLRRAVEINPYNAQKRAVLEWALTEYEQRAKS